MGRRLQNLRKSVGQNLHHGLMRLAATIVVETQLYIGRVEVQIASPATATRIQKSELTSILTRSRLSDCETPSWSDAHSPGKMKTQTIARSVALIAAFERSYAGYRCGFGLEFMPGSSFSLRLFGIFLHQPPLRPRAAPPPCYDRARSEAPCHQSL